MVGTIGKGMHNLMDPIIGRTHTDLFKSRNRITNLGGKGGLKLTYFSADGFSYTQIIVFFAVFILWTLPLSSFVGIPWFGWGGLSFALLFGPPIGLAWASERTLPNGKTFRQWVTTRLRFHFVEKRRYAGGRPVITSRLNVNSLVWSPQTEGIND